MRAIALLLLAFVVSGPISAATIFGSGQYTCNFYVTAFQGEQVNPDGQDALQLDIFNQWMLGAISALNVRYELDKGKNDWAIFSTMLYEYCRKNPDEQIISGVLDLYTELE